MINTIKLARWVGNPFSLLIHTLILGGFLVLRYFGVISSGVLSALTTAVALESIFLVICLQIIVNKNTKSLAATQEKIEQIQKEEIEAHKLMIDILHTAHQMKSLQHDLDSLKKSAVFKHPGNGHRIRA